MGWRFNEGLSLLQESIHCSSLRPFVVDDDRDPSKHGRTTAKTSILQSYITNSFLLVDVLSAHTGLKEQKVDIDVEIKKRTEDF